MKAFITGICGFLGSHLADALIALGHEVEGNDNLICGSADNFAKFHNVDCRDFDGMKKCLEAFKPDVVYHCAATAYEGVSGFSPSYVTRNIYEASVATFSAAIACGVKRIINMSSMARYGAQSLPFHEAMTPRPVDPYGVAKVAAEQTLKILCDLHGVEYVNLVPHNIIGPRQKYNDPGRNVVSIMMNRALQGKDLIVYGDGQQKRCFSPIKDCLHSIVKALDAPISGETINIGPDRGEMTIGEMGAKITKLTGAKVGLVYMRDRPLEVKEAYCSSKKAREMLEFKPQQNIDDCLLEMIEAIKIKGVQPFDYFFPIEILTDKTPKTWADKLI